MVLLGGTAVVLPDINNTVVFLWDTAVVLLEVGSTVVLLRGTAVVKPEVGSTVVLLGCTGVVVLVHEVSSPQVSVAHCGKPENYCSAE